MASETREAVIVGAGIAGLAAAWDLRNRDVVVLEASERTGGRIMSLPRGDYWLNLGAHVWGGPGTASGRLIDDVGVEAVPVPGVLTAMALNGKIVSSGPVETFPLRLPMPWRDRLAVLRTGARIRANVERYNRSIAPRPGEDPSVARARTMAWLSDRTFAEFTGPLPPDADAMFRPTVSRSCGEPEVLAAGQGIAYFALVWQKGGGLSRLIEGGSSVLCDRIVAELGDRVRTGVRVDEVRDMGDHVIVRHAGGEIRARHAVIATPSYEAERLAPGLPDETRRSLREIPYGPLVCVGVLTDEPGPMPFDGLYALATPKLPFNMLFNTTNLVRSREERRAPGSSFMLYRSGASARAYLEQTDAEVEQVFVDALLGLYPGLRGHIREVVIRRLERSLPYPAPGRHLLQPALERPLGRLHLAGDYLGGWYTETSIASGQAAAKAIRANP